MEFKLDELVVNDNLEFVKCDKSDCEERGSYPLCYFDIYQNCNNYKKINEPTQRT